MPPGRKTCRRRHCSRRCCLDPVPRPPSPFNRRTNARAKTAPTLGGGGGHSVLCYMLRWLPNGVRLLAATAQLTGVGRRARFTLDNCYERNSPASGSNFNVIYNRDEQRGTQDMSCDHVITAHAQRPVFSSLLCAPVLSQYRSLPTCPICNPNNFSVTSQLWVVTSCQYPFLPLCNARR